MKIMLVRTRAKSAYNFLQPIVVEPLELEYMATILGKNGLKYFIQDEIISKKTTLNVFIEEKPQIVIMSGYLNNVTTILAHSIEMKKINPEVLIIVGGVHAEVNYKDFFYEGIDAVCYSGGFKPLEALIGCEFDKNFFQNIKGICYKSFHNEWITNGREVFSPEELMAPDRSFFYNNKKNFKYLNLGAYAMVKTSYGCPYACNFCYCRLLNGGAYTQRTLESVVEEIKKINCENIWIIDDTFLISRRRLIDFNEILKSHDIKKNFIVYSRADFIVENKDLLSVMKEIGIKQVIVGLEAMEDLTLKEFTKGTDSNVNKKCVELLNESGIQCVGLFVTHIDYKKEDFNKLYKWIKSVGLKLCTFSIYTPLPGTELYEKYKQELRFKNYDYMDFLHLLVKPRNLSVRKYYYYFYSMQLKIYLNSLKLMILGR